MKKIINLLIILLIVSSCNQNSPAPAPAAPAAPAPTPTTTATSSMTATETLLVGDWIWDKKEFYTSGNLSYTWDAAGITNANGSATTSTVFAGSHMVLKSSLFANIVRTPQFYDADYYCGTSAQSGEWWVTHYPTIDELKVSSSCGIFTSGGGNFISTLNATTLILQDWMPGQIANGNKVYFHK